MTLITSIAFRVEKQFIILRTQEALSNSPSCSPICDYTKNIFSIIVLSGIKLERENVDSANVLQFHFMGMHFTEVCALNIKYSMCMPM
jgi:hypothetical protein